MKKDLDVVLFGEAMAMFIADDYLPLEEANHYTRAMAGAELNVSVGLVRLGYRVGWISRLGADPTRAISPASSAAGRSGYDTCSLR